MALQESTPTAVELARAADGVGPDPRAACGAQASVRPADVAAELGLGRKSRLVFYLLLGLVHGLSLLPDFVLYPLGALGGLLGYFFDRRHVRIGLTNLGIAFPERSERERRRILRASYVNLGRSAAEYVRLGGFFYQRLARRVTYHRLELWAEGRTRYPGRGFLVLTAHFGNFELLPSVHAMHGYRISLVHHTQRFLAGDALLTYVRRRAGVRVIRKHSAARAVLEELAAGEVVGIPFDQNAKRSEAIFVPFFGEPAATPGAVARLAVKSNCLVGSVFLVRQSDGRSHRLEVQGEVPIQRSGELRADIEENTRRFVKAIEEMVRRHPEQFLWTHRRYRTRPRGMPALYEPKRPRA